MRKAMVAFYQTLYSYLILRSGIKVFHLPVCFGYDSFDILNV